MWKGLLSDIINNKLEKSNLINEHALNYEPFPLREEVPFLGKPHSSRGSGKGAYFESYMLSYRKGDVWCIFHQNKTIRSNISTSTRDGSINPSTRIWPTWRHFDFSGTEVFSCPALNTISKVNTQKKNQLNFQFLEGQSPCDADVWIFTAPIFWTWFSVETLTNSMRWLYRDDEVTLYIYRF